MLFSKKTKFKIRKPKTEADYLAKETACRFNDLKSLKFYKSCFRKNIALAKRAAAVAGADLSDGVARNPGAIFTYNFKKDLKNKAQKRPVSA